MTNLPWVPKFPPEVVTSRHTLGIAALMLIDENDADAVAEDPRTGFSSSWTSTFDSTVGSGVYRLRRSLGRRGRAMLGSEAAELSGRFANDGVRFAVVTPGNDPSL
jgi:hypothetical protein